MSLQNASIPDNLSSAALNDSQDGTHANQCHDFEDWKATLLGVYILLVAVLGIIFNVFVLMVFCLHKKACTVAEIYLSNLAAADLILVCCLPFWAVYAYNKFNWPYDDFMCPMITLTIVMNACCSIYFLVLVSIDRYLALVHPLSNREIRGPKHAKLGCLLVWFMGLLLGIPSLIYRKTKHIPTCNKTVCHMAFPSENLEQVSEGLLILFSFIIPISIISFCTFKIIHSLNNRVHSRNSEQKAATLILAVLAAFLVCWTPFHLVKIVEMFHRAKIFKEEMILEIFKNIVMYIAFFNSVLNPILYVIVGKKFRKKVKEFFMQCSNKRTGLHSFHSKHSYVTRRTIVSMSGQSTRLPFHKEHA
ncbi:B2 bradykinin receptor-like [Echeneis naucrates]|uniref:B2 bradykinin receptor-like n=1 Tax=Echeneis naucrates TaxID=173247 RepID=A0A665WC04_ECHNA|nr:B2 bradykinin receptor-like [Echeneis naucrates]